MLAGRVEPKVAAVVTQIVGAHCRLLELEKKVKETEEFEARVEAHRESRRNQTVTELKGWPESGSSEHRRLVELYQDVWVSGGSLEDISEEDRYPDLYEIVIKSFRPFLTSKNYYRNG